MTMWPMLLDMTKLECKKDLRKLGKLDSLANVFLSNVINHFWHFHLFFLELEAYSLLVSTFRAQGNLNPKKIQILKDLEQLLKYK